MLLGHAYRQVGNEYSSTIWMAGRIASFRNVALGRSVAKSRMLPVTLLAVSEVLIGVVSVAN